MRGTLPLILALIGLAIGGAGGLYLKAPAPVDPAMPGIATEPATGAFEYAKMNNQFIVPILENGRVASLVMLSLSLEVTPGASDAVFVKEPKLRDAFLQVLFDHANTGGFRGSFTDAGNLDHLRKALREEAQSLLGPDIHDILITEIGRQDS